RKKIETLEEFEKVYPPGSKIYVPSIGGEGLVQGKANSKGEILVLANSMRLSVHWTQLRPSQTVSNPTQNALRRASGIQVTLQDMERTVDLRGKSTEDALKLLESQLDAAALNSELRVKIVHGHGTEVIKRMVRSHLSRSMYVKKWRAGGPESGGDGVTWAELKD
ncbi:MAG: Smr/MutS family protein, partial [Bdellovibrionales bacterium]|nr:Smr/MutS family protein [Bdellovibrionales bacterium]